MRERAGGYQTSQKKKIIDFMRAHPDRQFTADEICKAINTAKVLDGSEMTASASASKVGLSTVYRQLISLCNSEILHKFSTEGGSSVYQFASPDGNCSHHFHLKCIECGRIIHLDCRMSDELLAHIADVHGFEVNSGKSVLYGICDRCSSAESPKGGSGTPCRSLS